MKTTMISAVMCVLFSAAASAALANGPMGNSSSASASSRSGTSAASTRSPAAGSNRPGADTYWGRTGNGNRSSIAGIVEASRQAADGLHGTEWSNRGIRGLWQGALETCSFGRYTWDRRNSCQGAADDRARVIGERLEQMRRNSQLGDYTVAVGSRNGYTVWGRSLHTDTGLEIRDRSGRVVGSYVIDNYVGRSLRGTTATPVSTGTIDFDPITGNSTVIRTIGGGRGGGR